MITNTSTTAEQPHQCRNVSKDFHKPLAQSEYNFSTIICTMYVLVPYNEKRVGYEHVLDATSYSTVIYIASFTRWHISIGVN